MIRAGILAAVPSLSACASSDKAADAPKPASASAAAAATPGPDRCTAGYVALTFDDGPTPMTSAYVQALAAAGNTRATFFLTGAHAEKDPGTVRALVEAGHAVGNHSYAHPYLDQEGEPKAFNELLGTNQIVKSAAGSAPTLFRPPFGRTNAQIRDDARRLGMTGSPVDHRFLRLQGHPRGRDHPQRPRRPARRHHPAARGIPGDRRRDSGDRQGPRRPGAVHREGGAVQHHHRGLAGPNPQRRRRILVTRAPRPTHGPAAGRARSARTAGRPPRKVRKPITPNGMR
ncbi:polysaccharide deacetylase family protein [Yinghuangia aomiensis]